MSKRGIFKATITHFDGKLALDPFVYAYTEVTRDQAARWAVEDYIREHEDYNRQLMPSRFEATVVVEGSCGNKSFHEVVAQAEYIVYIPWEKRNALEI